MKIRHFFLALAFVSWYWLILMVSVGLDGSNQLVTYENKNAAFNTTILLVLGFGFYAVLDKLEQKIKP